MSDIKKPDPIGDIAGFSGERLTRIDTFFNVEVARGGVPGPCS